MKSRFLFDEMLVRLGRWMRSAGYDAGIASSGTGDAALIAAAIIDDRLVVTRDRRLAERRGAAGRVLVLASSDLPGQARELAEHCRIDWLFRPFTRCVVDNTVLVAASSEHIAAAPPGVRARGGPFMACPSCARLYWQGSHHERMRARLEA